MKKRDFIVGMLCGALVLGAVMTGAAAVSTLTATPSSQQIFVDGKQAAITAYAIEGRNYVQLRDVGRAVGFAVDYNAATNSIQVDTAKPYTEEVKATPTATPAPSTAPSDGVITIPQSDEKLNLKVGDKVRCDDGSIYEIKDLNLQEDVGPLPTPTCDWSQFPEIELPKVRVTTDGNGNMAILNLYETRRMQYTIYNAAATSSQVWENGTLKLSTKGNPYFKLHLGLINQTSVQSFWPWRDKQLTQVFLSVPTSQFAVVAWDTYYNGKFLYTEYKVQAV